MNWGKAVVLIFIGFAAFIGTMIYWMCRERVDLVRDDYYQTEIAYQQQINRMANTQHHAPVAIRYQALNQQVTVDLPSTLRKGELHFYRPADGQLDFVVLIPAGHGSQHIVPTSKLARGPWRVKFTWSDEARDYYTEQNLIL